MQNLCIFVFDVYNTLKNKQQKSSSKVCRCLQEKYEEEILINTSSIKV